MPISSSAKKSLRVSQRRRQINLRRLKLLKLALKNVSLEKLPHAFSQIDKAVKNKLWHRHKAARIKSRLAREFASEPRSSQPASKSKAAKSKKPTAKATKETKRSSNS